MSIVCDFVLLERVNENDLKFSTFAMGDLHTQVPSLDI
jgi:hypothetical protein